ncbi:hypothetical protein NON00_13660 [Roseomonas sp. GC11]|uniref:hypothetical protein n=1 Tax=Roseomonas sp. GC11 TaxID=2950546 RepID=UPI0021088F42|nr:hypothetical protein [Roseomonas sp. GC11]MCQ4160972.1 hypothetical protein [Roseomonas sp. GC11]
MRDERAREIPNNLLRARSDRIFTHRTGSVILDRLLARLHRRKAKLLHVLLRSEIPLHTNGSENDIRACGTMSEEGRTTRDVLLCLMKTCRNSASRSTATTATACVSQAPRPSHRCRISSVKPPLQPEQTATPAKLSRLHRDVRDLYFTVLDQAVAKRGVGAVRAETAGQLLCHGGFPLS